MHKIPAHHRLGRIDTQFQPIGYLRGVKDATHQWLQIFLVLISRLLGSMDIYMMRVVSKFSESDPSLVSRVFAVTEPHPARIPTVSSSKFVSQGGRWRVAGTSLLLATVEK
jgi:hypothetical protein